MAGNGPLIAACMCELRQRSWNPNTGRCEFCGRRYADSGARSSGADKRGTSWGVVRDYVDQLRHDNASLIVGADAVLTLVLKDLTYGAVGVPYIYESLGMLGPWGQDMADAYAGMLEGVSHLVADLAVNGKSLTTKLDKVSSDPTQRHLHEVQELCVSQIRAAIQLRALIKERCAGDLDLKVSTPCGV